EIHPSGEEGHVMFLEGTTFGLESQAATMKESLKSWPSISIDVVSSDKVAATEAKIEALPVDG
ncbi:hypothetical protein A2U01_0061094, partial [Trifolium medium]|nr:hypothetical protein [Trifolium medium]